MEMGVIDTVPSALYAKISDLHQSAKRDKAESLPLDGLPETETLFYGDDPAEFDATVLKAWDNCVVLGQDIVLCKGRRPGA